MEERRCYNIKLSILGNMGIVIPSQERLDQMSTEELNEEFQTLLEKSRSENESKWKDYIQIGKNISEILKDNPSLKEKLLVGVSGDIREYLDCNL